MISDLIEMGFVEHEDNFVRLCFSECIDRKVALRKIGELSPESSGKYRGMSDVQLERWCSPLGLEKASQGCFLIPIRPGYAMDLFDRNQSSTDLFVGKIKVLLRWKNVYYKRKSHHRMLNPPARILWYVSGRGHQRITAVSHLDSVEIDFPKTLYRKYRRFRTLDWQDIYQMCNRDPTIDLMALKFSHTFLFREPISLATIETIYQQQGANLIVQSPSRVPPGIFRKLFNHGHPDHS